MVDPVGDSPATPEPAPDPLPADRPVAPMDPEVALRRIAYLLDRSHAPASKTRAFLRAADVVADEGPDAVAHVAGQGRLRTLAGIGASTGAVIEQALAGAVPDYLARWEAEPWATPSVGAQRVLTETRGDAHTHSRWSDGAASIAEMARTAALLGHEWMVLTDHSPRLTIAHGLSPERLAAQLDEVDALADELAPFRLLTGMEVDILEDGALDLPDELLARLDLVVGSVHAKLRLEHRAMTERLVRAVTNPHVDVLGHCTGRLVSGRTDRPEDADPKRPPSRFDAELVFRACALTGTAVEVNARPERLDPPDELLRLAVEVGCLVAIDTDAHAPGQLEWQVHGAEKVARVGVPPERIVTSWSADAVLAWTADHAAS